MNPLTVAMICDLFVIICSCIAGVFSWHKGFVREFFSLIGWLGAAAITSVIYTTYIKPITQTLETKYVILGQVLGYIVVFALCLAFFYSVSHFLSAVVRASFLCGADSLLGVLMGAFNCWFGMAMTIWFIKFFAQSYTLKDTIFIIDQMRLSGIAQYGLSLADTVAKIGIFGMFF